MLLGCPPAPVAPAAAVHRSGTGASYPKPPPRPISATIRAGLHLLMRDHLDALVLRGRDETARTAAEVYGPFHAWTQARSIDLLAINRDQLEAYQDFLVSTYRTPAGKPLARSTASARISILKSLFGWLTDTGHLVADPARHLGVHVPRSRTRVTKDAISLQEATALLQTQATLMRQHRTGSASYASDLRNLAALAVGLSTGRRIGGVRAFTLAQLDRERREVRIEREKGHVGRVLPIAGWAVDVVDRYILEARPFLTRGHDTPWLFPNLAGDGPVERCSLSTMLERLLVDVLRLNPDLTDLGRKRVTWHALRVSFASFLFQNGCDIRCINELLLHRSLTTTAAYVPVGVEDMRAVFRTAHPRA